MEQYDTLIQTLALTFGVAWASGINLYALILVLGLGGLSGEVQLPNNLDVLTNPMVIGAAGLGYLIEFVADKTPGVDTAWDGLHSFIRIPAGAMLAVATVGDSSAAMEIAAGILGASLAGTSHLTKASTRLAINTSPEPFSNWTASISEDILVIGGIWTALNHPLLFLIFMVIFIGLVIWLLPKLLKLIVRMFRKVKSWITGTSDQHQLTFNTSDESNQQARHQ